MPTFNELHEAVQATETISRRMGAIGGMLPAIKNVSLTAYAPQRAALRAILGDTGSASPTDKERALMVFASPAASRRALATRMNEILAIQDPSERLTAIQQVIDLQAAQDAYSRFIDPDMSSFQATIGSQDRAILNGNGYSDRKKVPSNEFLMRFSGAVANTVAAGAAFFPDDFEDRAKEAASTGTTLTVNDYLIYAPNEGAELDRISKEMKQLAADIKTNKAERSKLLSTALKAAPEDEAEIAKRFHQLNDDRTAMVKKYKSLERTQEKQLKLLGDIFKRDQHKHTARKTALIDAGQEIYSKAMQASPVTAEEAKAWADAQEVTPAAAKAMLPIGYSEAECRKDMAEFYRMTQGRLDKIRIDSTGSRRAHANDIGEHTVDGFINVGSGLQRVTLWHEMAHHLEASTDIRYQSSQWIRGRAESDKRYTLSSLTGNSSYSSDEVALKGPFADPYVSKLYSDGMTEVMSMGMQYLANPDALALALEKDSEHVKYVLGIITKPQNDLQRAAAVMRQMVLGAATEAKGVQVVEIEHIQKEIGQWIKLMPSSLTASDFSRSGNLYGATSQQINSLTMMGEIEAVNPNLQAARSSHKFYLFKGLAKPKGTRRLSNGYVIVSEALFFPANLGKFNETEAMATAAIILAKTNFEADQVRNLKPVTEIYEAMK